MLVFLALLLTIKIAIEIVLKNAIIITLKKCVKNYDRNNKRYHF